MRNPSLTYALALCLAACAADDGEDSPTLPDGPEFEANPDRRYCAAETDHDVDGVDDVAWTYQWDAVGHLTMERAQNLADGSVSVTATTYSPEGNRISRTYSTDGMPRRIDYYRHDDMNHLVDEELDLGGDGEIDACLHYSYSEAGLRVGGEGDDGCDGSIEWRGTYAYDDRDQLVETVTRDRAGNVALRVTYERDREGRIVRVVDDFAESSDREASYAYDAAGRLIQYIWSSAGDRSESTYAYDAEGRLATLLVEADYGGGLLYSLTTYRYACGQRRALETSSSGER